MPRVSPVIGSLSLPPEMLQQLFSILWVESCAHTGWRQRSACGRLLGNAKRRWFQRGFAGAPDGLDPAQLRTHFARGEASTLTVTTRAQAQGSVWEHLRDRYRDEPVYPPT